MKLTFAAALSFLLIGSAAAQPSPGPQPSPSPMPSAIPAPRDVAYPGVMTVDVDATDVDRRIFRVKQTIPLAGPGPVTLLYPEWVPGGHSPRNPLDKLAGLIIRAGGQVVPWARDPTDAFAFHVTPPPGAAALELEFQFLSPTAANQGRIQVTPEISNPQWLSLALYPAGYYTRRIQVQASLRLPDGWKYATALETASVQGGLVRFAPTDFDTFVDSPVFAGRYFRQFDLDPGGRSPVRLNVVADSPELLEARPDQIEKHRAMVRQADKLFGARHFDHYDFLLALSDRLGSIGLEHQRSSENGATPEYFTGWERRAPARNLLPHEYSHAWVGKYRRPADLWTPNYNSPMGGSLLWLYEGQDTYWGYVLGARSGLVSRQDTLDALAITAAAYGEGRPGRAWRPVEDTTLDPIIANRRPIPWTSWQRNEDYYQEGQLVWLDVDTLIRDRTNGRKSLDDFARAFFGVNDGDWKQPLTYAFEDVVAGLNAVTPYDWASFLDARFRQVSPRTPLDGLARGGWRLVFTETPTDGWTQNDLHRKIKDFSYSIGLTLDNEGAISGVLWEGPAFKAGLTVGGRLLAVNGLAYSVDGLKSAITEAKSGKPITLIVRDGEHFEVRDIAYRGGLRYPRLERIPGAPDRLSDILAPK